MRRIKAKPIKRLSFKPAKDVQFVYCLPIEGALFYQQQADQHAWERGLARLRARLNGEPVPIEPDYFSEVMNGD